MILQVAIFTFKPLSQSRIPCPRWFQIKQTWASVSHFLDWSLRLLNTVCTQVPNSRLVNCGKCHASERVLVLIPSVKHKCCKEPFLKSCGLLFRCILARYHSDTLPILFCNALPLQTYSTQIPLIMMPLISLKSFFPCFQWDHSQSKSPVVQRCIVII